MGEYGFVHIPKNAGQSFEKILKDISEIDYFFHSTPQEKMANHKKIYILREPIDRFTSAFFYLKFYKRNLDNKIFDTPEQLLTALKNLDKRALEFMKVHDHFHTVNGEKIPTDWVFHKQSAWIHDPWKVILYDKLKDGWKEVCDTIGINVEIPHINKSRKSEFEYSKDSLDLLKVIYREDFELYEQYRRG